MVNVGVSRCECASIICRRSFSTACYATLFLRTIFFVDWTWNLSLVNGQWNFRLGSYQVERARMNCFASVYLVDWGFLGWERAKVIWLHVQILYYKTIQVLLRTSWQLFTRWFEKHKNLIIWLVLIISNCWTDVLIYSRYVARFSHDYIWTFQGWLKFLVRFSNRVLRWWAILAMTRIWCLISIDNRKCVILRSWENGF